MNKRAVIVDESQVEEDTLVAEEEQEEVEIEASENESAGDQPEESEPQAQEEESDEVIVSIGEEAPPVEEETRAPEWVRELRKANREKERRIRELEAKLQTTQTENKPVVLGQKPKLEDYDYDADRFEQAIDDWHARKRQHDLEAEMAKQAEQHQMQAWQSKLENYSKAKAELRVRDYEDAESVAQETLNVVQQGVILQGADNPALVVYAIGKNPKKAAELSKINDPVKFAFAVAKLEKELKVTNRKAAPPPERAVRGTGPVSGSVDSTLERLRAEAEKTGNYTKVVQYKRQKQAARA
jgi:hypothetical protein